MRASARARSGSVAVLLGLLAVGGIVAHLHRYATAWHWFDDAARLLVGDEEGLGVPGGLRLYAERPDFQFGPLAILVALPFSLLGRIGDEVLVAVLSAAGLLTVGLLAGAARRRHPELPSPTLAAAVACGGAAVVVLWSHVAVRTAHLDDAVALTLAALALWCLVHDRPWAAAVALGVAAAVKPWAVAFTPVAAAAPGRARWGRVLLALALAGATWVPFVLAEPATLDTSRYTIENEPASALRALGVDSEGTPSWGRPAQLLLGTLVAALLVRRGRWTGAMMAALAVRVALDPAANHYYTAGVVVAVLAHELLDRPGRWPWRTVAVGVLLEVSAVLEPPRAGGVLRLLVAAAVLVAAWTAPAMSPPGAAAPRAAGRRVEPARAGYGRPSDGGRSGDGTPSPLAPHAEPEETPA